MRAIRHPVAHVITKGLGTGPVRVVSFLVISSGEVATPSLLMRTPPASVTLLLMRRWDLAFLPFLTQMGNFWDVLRRRGGSSLWWCLGR